MRRLPPLNSLRAFESTARHLSFTKGANELNVTAGAVSQQVKVLEEYLGLKLFKRQNRMVSLTQEALMLLPYLTEGLDKLVEGMDAIHSYQLDKPLTITLPPTFAARWLMPRLMSFQKRHPEIDVRIDATYKVVDIINEDIDAGIRFGTGNYSGMNSDFLFSQSVILVCSPDLLKQGSKLQDQKLEKAEDLKDFTLLHCDYSLTPTWQQPSWDVWFQMAGLDNIDTTRGVHFAQHDLLVQAAIEGQGVALVARISAAKAIKDGLLVQPFDSHIPLDNSYYFIYPKAKANLPRIRAFRNWLLEEVKESK